jgi:hypothetical protein
MTPEQFCIWLDGYLQSYSNVDSTDDYDYDFKIDIIQKFKEVNLDLEGNSIVCKHCDDRETWQDTIDRELEPWIHRK